MWPQSKPPQRCNSSNKTTSISSRPHLSLLSLHLGGNSVQAATKRGLEFGKGISPIDSRRLWSSEGWGLAARPWQRLVMSQFSLILFLSNILPLAMLKWSPPPVMSQLPLRFAEKNGSLCVLHFAMITRHKHLEMLTWDGPCTPYSASFSLPSSWPH